MPMKKLSLNESCNAVLGHTKFIRQDARKRLYASHVSTARLACQQAHAV